MTKLFSGLLLLIKFWFNGIKMEYSGYNILHVFGFTLDKLESLFSILILTFLKDFRRRVSEKDIFVTLVFYIGISNLRTVIQY